MVVDNSVVVLSIAKVAPS